VDWLRVGPFMLLHLVCFAPIWVGWSPFAVGFALFMFLSRMFAVTAFYHRYFLAQVVQDLAFHAVRVRRAGKHHHPARADLVGVASPAGITAIPTSRKTRTRRSSTGCSGATWAGSMSKAHFAPRLELVKDLVKFPELRFHRPGSTRWVPLLCGVFALRRR